MSSPRILAPPLRPQAHFSFELDWTNGDAAQLEANSAKALEMAQNNIAKKIG